MSKARKPIEAGELVRSVGRDPAIPKTRQKVSSRGARGGESSPSPIVTELRAQGFPIENVADLYNRRLDYRRAIPTLIKWLPRVDDADLKESIVRALSVRWAKPAAAKALAQAFPHADDPNWFGLRWAISNALAVVADDSVFDDLVRLLRDKGYGKSRQMLAVSLANMKDPRAVDVLIECLQDEDIASHAVLALGKLKPAKAESHLERFISHPTPWIRKEAAKALERIRNRGQVGARAKASVANRASRRPARSTHSGMGTTRLASASSGLDGHGDDGHTQEDVEKLLEIDPEKGRELHRPSG